MIDPLSTIAVAHNVHHLIRDVSSKASNSAKLLKLKASLKELDALMAKAQSKALKEHQNDSEWVDIADQLENFYVAYADILPRYAEKSLLQRVLGYAEIKREVDIIRVDLKSALEKIEAANRSSQQRANRLNGLYLKLKNLRFENETGMTPVQSKEREEKRVEWKIDVEEIIKLFRKMCDDLTVEKEYNLKEDLVNHAINSMLEIADFDYGSPKDNQKCIADKSTKRNKSHSNARARGKKAGTARVRFQSGNPASPRARSHVERTACDLVEEIIEVESDASDDGSGSPADDDGTNEGTEDL